MTLSSTDTYRNEYDKLGSILPGKNLVWFKRLRDQSIAKFSRSGFFDIKNEDWHFTNLSVLRDRAYSSSAMSEGTFDTKSLKGIDAYHLVFIDGKFKPSFSTTKNLPSGVTLYTFRDMLDQDPDLLKKMVNRSFRELDHPELNLNLALMSDGFCLKLSKGTKIDKPIHFVHHSCPRKNYSASHLHNLVFAEEDSCATIVDSYSGDLRKNYFSNIVNDIQLEPRAKVFHYRVQGESSEAISLAKSLVCLKQGSLYENFCLSTGGALSRNEVRAVISGKSADCKIAGLSLGCKKQHLDNSVWVHHHDPGSTSRQIFGNLLTDFSKGVFQGSIAVDDIAQQTNAYQLCKNILLSDTASAYTKPELQINADDVKCSHGATTGELDPRSIFYLCSRGIQENDAKKILLGAFVDNLLKEILVIPVREYFKEKVRFWLRRQIH